MTFQQLKERKFKYQNIRISGGSTTDQQLEEDRIQGSAEQIDVELRQSPVAMTTEQRMPSPVFRAPINVLSQENVLNNTTLDSLQLSQPYHSDTLINDDTIVGGIPMGEDNFGILPPTSEDWQPSFTVNSGASSNRRSTFSCKNILNKLSVLYSNCDCLTQIKKQELEALIVAENPDITPLTEIFPKKSLFGPVEEFYNLEGYVKIISDLEIGRGVVIYIKSVSSPIHEIIKNSIHKFNESVWAKIKLNATDTLLVGCIYRSPISTRENTDLLLSFEKCIKKEIFTHLNHGRL